MNYRELITQLTPQRGAGEARAIVRLVMEERFGLTQTDLLLCKDTTFSADDRAEFEKIAQRLLSGEPVQYVLGSADFCGHRFRVTPDVLIPRPETEELVRWVLEDYPPTDSAGHISPEPDGLRILDLCTGSGCIATTLALAYPTAHVIGVDISQEALHVARQNAADLGATNVEFFRQDILESDQQQVASSREPAPLGLTASAAPAYPPTTSGTFDLLLSNPPYVLAREAVDMERHVLDHEPHLALFVPDEDPLRFYRAIASIALRVLSPSGHVYVEINAALSEETRQLFLSANFQDVQLRHDQFGRPRLLRAQRP